jgi:hypothetical protein
LVDSVVTSWNKIRPYFGDVIEGDVIDTELPDTFGDVDAVFLMRFWG